MRALTTHCQGVVTGYHLDVLVYNENIYLYAQYFGVPATLVYSKTDNIHVYNLTVRPKFLYNTWNNIGLDKLLYKLSSLSSVEMDVMLE